MDVITFPKNLLTTSGLLILLHGVILLQDATSYDKKGYYAYQYKIFCNEENGHFFQLQLKFWS